ncbi:MAG TPA: hypothetical protein VGT43_01640 [Burkholderiales bacterium]|nr:hypothetical protein [Burkholderiales bacterium]
MLRLLPFALLLLAGAAMAQEPLTPEERTFAALPQDVRALLSGFPAREALQKYDFARQNLIALGTPYPSPERLRAQVEAVLAPRYMVQSWSAGATSFPPLSPLVPSSAFEYR